MLNPFRRALAKVLCAGLLVQIAMIPSVYADTPDAVPEEQAVTDGVNGSTPSAMANLSDTDELASRIALAQGLFRGDYQVDNESWSMMMTAITNGEAALEHNEGVAEALQALNDELANLQPELDDYVHYSFKDGISPFYIAHGAVAVDGSNQSSIDVENDGKSFKVNTEPVNGVNSAVMRYSFAKPLDDKKLSFWFRDLRRERDDFTIRVGDDQNAIVLWAKNNGSSDGYYFVYEIVNGVQQPESATEIRRLADWHLLSFDFASQDGAAMYMDERLLLQTDKVSQFDSMTVDYQHAAKASSFVIDEFVVQQENPVTQLTLPDESAVLGYYDTYEISPAKLSYMAQNPLYPTTDRFSYTVSDSDILHVSAGGSVQGGANLGVASATVTASSGASASVQIEHQEIQATSIAISSSSITDEPNIVDQMTLQAGDIQVLNAILTEGATDRHADWVSSDESVVIVQDGLVVANQAGTAMITASTKDGNYNATVQVTVTGMESHVYGKELFVSTSGDDTSGDGSMDQPYATLEKARDVIRESDLPDGGVVVYFREGVYIQSNGIVFDEQDSGTADQPIVYRAYEDEKVVLRGSVTIPSDAFMKVDEVAPLADELQTAVHDHVYVVDLQPYGINQPKKLQLLGHSAGVLRSVPELSVYEENGENYDVPYYSVLFDNQDMVLAKYPNTGQLKISSVPDPGAKPRSWKDDILGRPDYVEPDQRFPYDGFEIKSSMMGDRYKNWIGVDDIWMSGYWFNEFSDQTVPVKEIREDGTIESRLPSAYGVANGKLFTVYNLIQELDMPGEWYIDQDNFDLYLYPPADTDMQEDHDVQIPILQEDMFTFNNTSNISVEGIDMEVMLGQAVTINGGHDNVIKDVRISGTRGKAGSISNWKTEDQTVLAKRNGFINSTFEQVNGGVSISAGNEETLERGDNYVIGSTFKTFSTINRSYNPAISLSGVGNRIVFNDISDGPHNAIMFSGNDHVIEFNEIYDVVKEAGDQSAIYTGRKVLDRGTVIRNNYFHHIGNESTSVENSAVYLDDLAAGIRILDNVFEHVYWGVFINGGRDNDVIGNTFSQVKDGLAITNWGYTGVNNWNVHGYKTYKHPDDMSLVTIDWHSENSPYRKYANLQNLLVDQPYEGKYGKAIDNQFNQVQRDDIHVVNRAVGLDAENWVKGWYYMKGNTATGELTKYDVSSLVNPVEAGTVSSSRAVLAGRLHKVIADARIGYKFTTWTDQQEAVSVSPTYIFSVQKDTSLTANFAPRSQSAPLLTAEDISVTAGETFSLQIRLKQVGDLGRLKAVIHYDQDVLTLDRVEMTDAFTTKEYNASVAGKVTFDAVNEAGITSEDVIIATLVFTAKADITEAAATQISFADIEANKTSEEPYGLTAQESTIMIDLLIVSGDISGDGKIDGLDALMLMKHLANADTLTPGEARAADYDGDGELTASDALKMLMKSVGLND